MKRILVMAIILCCSLTQAWAEGYNPTTKFMDVHMIEGDLLLNLQSNDDINHWFNFTSPASSTYSLGYGLGYWFGMGKYFLLGAGIETYGRMFKVSSLDNLVSWNFNINGTNFYGGGRLYFLKTGKFYSYCFGKMGFLTLNSITSSTVDGTVDGTAITSAHILGSGASLDLGLGETWVLGSWLFLGAEFGYRMAKISPVFYSSNGTQAIQNTDGTNAAVDFSGCFGKLTLTYAFGGVPEEEVITYVPPKPTPVMEVVEPDYYPPQDSTVFEKGVGYFEHDLYVKALYYFQESCRAEPNNPKAWLYLGQTYWYLDYRNNAFYAFNKYLTLDPTNKKLQKWIADQQAETQKNQQIEQIEKPKEPREFMNW